jgi:hypothetical protein
MLRGEYKNPDMLSFLKFFQDDCYRKLDDINIKNTSTKCFRRFKTDIAEIKSDHDYSDYDHYFGPSFVNVSTTRVIKDKELVKKRMSILIDTVNLFNYALTHRETIRLLWLHSCLKKKKTKSSSI